MKCHNSSTLLKTSKMRRMGSKFYVTFKRASLTCHTKCWAHTLQNVILLIFVWFTISLNCDDIDINEMASGVTVVQTDMHEQSNKDYKENKAVNKQNKTKERTDWVANLRNTLIQHTAEATYLRKPFWFNQNVISLPTEVWIIQLNLKIFFSNFKIWQQSPQHYT